MKSSDSDDNQSDDNEETTFRLEIDDSVRDSATTGHTKRKAKANDRSGATLDSRYQPESEEFPLIVGFNPNFDKPQNQNDDKNDSNNDNVYDRERIFRAVSEGDPEALDGLLEYLQRTSKQLTDTRYKDPDTGKTCLLKAMLNLKQGKNETVPLLLDVAEQIGGLKELVNAAYTDTYYKGQTALHIAIERRNIELVELLISKGANVHAKACGEFFQQKKEGNGFYFGELPLSLAACTNQLNIVKFLLDNPYKVANIAAKDSSGNTVLHTLVIIADETEDNTTTVTTMYDHILKLGAKIKPDLNLETISNNDGLTPLKLAALMGKLEIFKHIIRREIDDLDYKHLSRKFTEWVYGPVQSSLYDLTSLDTYEKNSVLDIIVNSSKTQNRHKMIQVEPLNKLLQDKWDRFASYLFYVCLIVYIVYMFIFTCVAYYRPVGDKPSFSFFSSGEGYLRLFGIIITMLGGVYFLLRWIQYCIQRRPRLKTILIDSFFEVLFLLQSITLLLSAVVYAAGKEEYVTLLVFSLATGWFNVLYYTRGFQLMGIYSVMIQKMILRDIVRFLLVYAVFLFGFAVAVVVLVRDTDNDAENKNGTACTEVKPYSDLYFTCMDLFKFTIGMGDLEAAANHKFQHMFIFLLIMYITLTYILLLNMLIALMSETVTNISAESQSIWKLQRAVTILHIEGSLPMVLREKFQTGKTIKVGITPDGKDDNRRCFRVEEVNWSCWNTDLRNINEDPGDTAAAKKNKK
ncbi:transient receptor potential cation channel subfamily V member 2 [Protopterus annectens]|uniref:transient receptor potential cation channel subfamily V member 2 n=1 Tax=Protopterus annectens TaxID=7888 RepID=UPI001CF9A3FD|nr:transient receptor potential cation channel subfamily V member 2 [Protopterus annectens]XP_043910461.1 transient receptor potential cation channel subfamily V member 2 [Protopterus annectens]XP_043910462.1 transient receptor potential cation channel subfamily V member 2 [Protopterus annectens]